MNVKIFEAIGKFIDNNYLIKYTIEGYFGFAYLKVDTDEGEVVWNFYLDNEGEVKYIIEK